MREVYPCGDGIWFEDGKWEFNENVTKVFPTHVRKSIPGYDDIHELVCTMIRTYSEESTGYRVLDLGCSVGELENKILNDDIDSKISIIAVDKSESMIERCNSEVKNKRVEFICEDIVEFLNKTNKKFDMVTCLYTLQFISKDNQKRIFENISKVLKDDGILILSDKFKNEDNDIDLIKEVELYKFKSKTGLSVEDIAGKKHALNGVQNRLYTSEIYEALEYGFKRIEVLDIRMNFICYVLYKNN